jgi:hypothetical protein
MKENYNNIITLLSCGTLLVLQLPVIQRKYAAGIASKMSALFMRSDRHNGGTVFRTTCYDPTPGSVYQDQQDTWNSSSCSFYPYHQTKTMQFLPLYLLFFSQYYIKYILNQVACLINFSLHKTKVFFLPVGLFFKMIPASNGAIQ